MNLNQIPGLSLGLLWSTLSPKEYCGVVAEGTFSGAYWPGPDTY